VAQSGHRIFFKKIAPESSRPLCDPLHTKSGDLGVDHVGAKGCTGAKEGTDFHSGEDIMSMIPSKIALRDFITTKLAAPVGSSFFSRLLGAMLNSSRRQEYREIARYQRLSGRQLTDSHALDTERRTLPNL
jgi:hypothetical protein